MRVEIEDHALADGDFAGIRFVDFALGHHPRQVGNLEHALHAPAAVADLFLVAAPVRHVDDRAVARREDGHRLDRVLRLRHHRRRRLLLAGQQRDLRRGRFFERCDALPDRLRLLLRQSEIELDLPAVFAADDFRRPLQLQLRLAQPPLGIGKLELLVFAAQREIGARLLDLLARLLALGALLVEPLLQLGRVEAEDRTADLHVGPLGRNHRDLEIPHVVDLRRTEAARIDRGKRAGDVDAGDEIAARDAHPVALTIGRELVARPPRAREHGGDGDADGEQRFSTHAPASPLRSIRSSPRTPARCTRRGRRRRACRPRDRRAASAPEKSIAARDTSSAFGCRIACTTTRAESPGRMRAASRRSSATITRNARRSDVRLLSCATAEIDATRAGKGHVRIGIEDDRGRHPRADPSVVDVGKIGFDLQRRHLRKLRQRHADENAVAFLQAAPFPRMIANDHDAVVRRAQDQLIDGASRRCPARAALSAN